MVAVVVDSAEAVVLAEAGVDSMAALAALEAAAVNSAEGALRGILAVVDSTPADSAAVDSMAEASIAAQVAVDLTVAELIAASAAKGLPVKVHDSAKGARASLAALAVFRATASATTSPAALPIAGNSTAFSVCHRMKACTTSAARPSGVAAWM